jgi:putative ABC transport system substrate-binding protein
VIGFVNSRSSDSSAYLAAAFRDGLKETGFFEERNVDIEYHWAEGHYERLPALLADLVHRQVAVIAAGGGVPVALAAKEATRTIPIVIVVGQDPVALRLVASLNRPGGNITGVTILNNELIPKLMQLLRDLLPGTTTIGFLTNPDNPAAEHISRDAQAVARMMGQQVHLLSASKATDFEPAFVSLVQLRAQALLVQGDPFLDSRAKEVVALAARYAVPAIYPFPEYVVAGGLLSYGTSLADAYRQIGVYTGRVLKGEKPSDLPVMQPTKFNLVINLKTAKALGVTVPPTVLALADEVIEP